MDTIVQWATILSPIIAVLLAWWTSRSGAREVRKIVASMKEMKRIQIALLAIQIEKDIAEATAKYVQTDKKLKKDAEYNEFLGRHVGGGMDAIHQKEERKRDMDSEKGYQYDLIMRLKYIQTQLELMKQQVQ